MKIYKESDAKSKKIIGGSRIDFDDDLVVVYENGEEIYRGMEDYEPMKYEDWKWDNKNKYYTLGSKYIKVCIS